MTNPTPWQPMHISPAQRAAALGQHAQCIWLTGLPASGKSSIASALDQQLHAQGMHTYVLDGDNLRNGLSHDLDFSPAARSEHCRRVAEVAKLMVDAGLVVIVCLIAPYRADRAAARARFLPGQFIEVFVDTPQDACERRDPKGHYALARSGGLAHFTGISSPYETPSQPELHLHTLGTDAATLASTVRHYITRTPA